jgi:L-cysteine desulfidase
LIGKSSYQLEVLKDSTPQAVEEGKAYLNEKRISIALKDDCTEKYMLRLCVRLVHHTQRNYIGEHTRFVFVSKDADVLLKEDVVADASPRKNIESDLTQGV